MTNPWTPPEGIDEEGAQAPDSMNPEDFLTGPAKDWAVSHMGDFARSLAARSGAKMAELMLKEVREREAAGLPYPDPVKEAEGLMAATFEIELPFGPSVRTEMVRIGMETFKAHFEMPDPKGSA